MDTYLQLCRSNLGNLSQFKWVSIVVGNESSDLDSAISAIVLAYVKYHEALASKPTDSDEEVIVMPVLNVPREDLHLRRELVFWFEQVLEFDLKVLICRDEIDYDQLNSSSAAITFSLVDHNENKEMARLLPRGRFEEIVDHHKPTYPEGACQVADQSRVLIDSTIGSCCSLVALRFLNCSLVSKFSRQDICTDPQIALFLYGPILLDTICFNHQAKRFNSKDYEAVNKLEDLLKHTPDAESSLFDRNDVYQRLVEAKNSLDGLSFNELLRKDTKIVESIADNNLAICIPAITGTKLTELSLKEKLTDLKEFSQNPPASAVFSEGRPRLFNAVVLLSMDNRIPNNLQRQLALYCENKLLMRTIATCIERNSELELELITGFCSDTLRCYNQLNLTATRKMVLPIISTILNGPGTQRSDAAYASVAQSAAAKEASVHSPARQRTTFSIATAEVDPDYLLTFKSKTISVPEFEEFIRHHSASDETKLTHASATFEHVVVPCPNSPENAKRSDSVGSDPSAPSSLIQQPDSYYGSYIEDSFVGDFVGDYMDPSNDHIQENILVMDADGQNLVMMNPNETISHSHEIEFDFDSFGPESIIYAGNVDAIGEKGTISEPPMNGVNGNATENGNEASHREEAKNEDETAHSGEDKSSVPESLKERSVQAEDTPLPEIAIETQSLKEIDLKLEDESSLENLKNAELMLTPDSGISSTSDLIQSTRESDQLAGNETDGQVEIELNSNEVTEKKEESTVPGTEEADVTTQPNLPAPVNTLGSFSRNSTLTRSQRKKVSPQVNIKNLIMASNTYSPPVLDPSIIPSLQSTDGSALSNGLNGEKAIDQSENFIISSLAQKQNEIQVMHSEASMDPGGSMDHPLGISASASHNSLGEFSSGGGLTRQPSMKKKIPVNYDMLLHNNFDKEDGDRPSNEQSLDHIHEPHGQDAPPIVSANSNHLTAEPEPDELAANGMGESFLVGNGEPRLIDMKVIEPYKKVISHGGYMHASADGRNVEGASPAIIIFSACYMPDRARKDYHYVMDNLFMYVLQTLHNMIADDYILIYLHNGGSQNAGPTFGWLKRCYQMIDRKLKKNLKGLYILHPTFWLKTIIIMSKPFISSKFSRKLKFVRSIEELREMIPIEHVAIPEPVKIYDQLVTSRYSN